jgi:hypothetical protein
MLFRGRVDQVVVQPIGLVLSQIRHCQFRPTLRAAEQVKASVSRYAGQPTFHRSASFVALEFSEGLQKNLLRCFFDKTPLPKELTGKPKNARAVSAHNLFEGRLIAFARQARQLQV